MGFLDWGRGFMNSLPVAGGVFSSIWGDPKQEAHQQSFDDAERQLAQQRAYQMDSRSNMMSQGALAFGPRNQMMGQMMGQQGPAMDLSQILKNPMSQQQQQDIRSSAFPNPGATDHNDSFQMLPPNSGTNFNYSSPGQGQSQGQGAPSQPQQWPPRPGTNFNYRR